MKPRSFSSRYYGLRYRLATLDNGISLRVNQNVSSVFYFSFTALYAFDYYTSNLLDDLTLRRLKYKKILQSKTLCNFFAGAVVVLSALMFSLIIWRVSCCTLLFQMLESKNSIRQTSFGREITGANTYRCLRTLSYGCANNFQVFFQHNVQQFVW